MAVECCETTQVTVPASVKNYETMFASSVGFRRAVTFAYARTALQMILRALNVRQGDEVILSPLTCKVVPLTLMSLSIQPVYADISMDSLNLDARRVEEAVGHATRAILFQHTYGSCTGVEAVARVARQRDLLLVEDCAQCMPLAKNGNNPGHWGRAAIFSNNLRKPLPAGSGGVAVTSDNELADSIEALRNQLPCRGTFAAIRLRLETWLHDRLLRPELYWWLYDLSRRLGTSYQVHPILREVDQEVRAKGFKTSDFQTRRGIKWMERVAAWEAHSRQCCAEYAGALGDLGGLSLPLVGGVDPLYYFPILVDNKEALLSEARKGRVELIAWPVKTPIFPLERQQDLVSYAYNPGSCPIADDMATKLVGLPTHTKITAKQRERTVRLLRDCVR